MNTSQINRFIQISITFAIALWLIAFLSIDNGKWTLSSVRYISPIALIVSIFWGVYFTKGWKAPLLKNILYKPDISGTWYGTLTSNYEPNNLRKIELVLVIRQTFLEINITGLSSEMAYQSYGEAFSYDKERQKRKLSYMYSPISNDLQTATERKGSAEIDIFGEPCCEMKGFYWTSSKSNGPIEFVKVSDSHIETFQEIINFSHVIRKRK